MPKPPHVRTRLQEIGESYRQAVDIDIWLNMFLTWVRTMREIMHVKADKIAVIDVRHPNEIACLKAIGGKILHLDPASKSLIGAQAQHISETAFEAVIEQERDAHIFNAKMGLAPLLDDVLLTLFQWGWV